jgi:hypothetical protein
LIFVPHLIYVLYCICLHMLNHLCIPGMKSTWSWCIIFLICCWILFATILLSIFASMFIKGIYNFPYLLCPYPVLNFFVGLGFELRTSYLKIRHSTAWAILSVLYPVLESG